MKDFFQKLINLCLDSNHYTHFLFAIPIGCIFTILCVLGVASGMEFKDKMWGGKWDWIDWTFTMLGGIIGQLLQLLILHLFGIL